ncbi:uncharacterized protein LOC143875795 isoform X3 [Tasmannia lanceolata]|uniref:uncharacterized protein LOC143875795 isoform X3 n=1 Tax=Tasmannia lanceolata TaxID=3420 RepID=UPI004063E5F1
MELHHLSFLPSEIDESEVDFRPFSDHPPAAFSPTPSNYESFFEAMEMELGKSSGTLPSFTCSNVDEEKKGNEEENDEGRGGKGNLENAGCKHLQRERNRRMRLNQQLLALRSLVPCISKMDKQSILMDALTYLQSIHQEIDQITREISTQEASDGLTTSFESNLSSPREIPRDSSSIHHQILQKGSWGARSGATLARVIGFPHFPYMDSRNRSTSDDHHIFHPCEEEHGCDS